MTKKDKLAWRIGRAQNADGDEIAALFRHTRQTSLPYLPTLHTIDEDRAHFARVIAECDVRMARTSAAIIGFVARRDRWIEQLYVDPLAHCQGVGTALLAAIRASCAELELWCFQENAVAIAFYERHGFVVVELTDGAGNEERAPDARYLWRRELGGFR